MKSYSLGRVAQYARYHYTSLSRNYLSLMLVIVGFMSIFGILSRDLMTSVDICMAIYLFGGIAFALRTTSMMRGREYKVRECTLPISNEERMTFMLFNLMVAFPLSLVVCVLLSLLIVYPFAWNPDIMMAIDRVMSDCLLAWPFYVLVQIICSASLLLNIVARRNLLLTYVAAFIGAIASLGITGKVGIEIAINSGVEHVEMWGLADEIARVVFILLPVAFYALAYWALRKRQIKW